MSSVTIEGVTKVFPGGVHAVRNLHLHVRNGEFAVILGPSGCGKSTTLNLIAGLDRPTSGRILFDSERVDYVPTHKRDVAMVFQTYALYPNMKVADNLSFGLRMRGIPRRERERRVAQAAEILGIADLLDRRPAQLSGGERQRVALGRAIVRQPRVFLLDEPLSSVDAKLRGQMRLELKALHRELRATFIYVTHDQVEAMSMGDRIAVMEGGVLQQFDAPASIYHGPANVFIAGFVGSPSMNMFDGRLVAEDRFRGSGFEYRWASALWSASVVGRSVTLGIRPTDVQLVNETTRDQEVHIAAHVEFREPLGADTFLSLRVGERLFVVRVDPGLSVRTGDLLRLHVPEDSVHLFSAADGRRLRPQVEL